MLIKRSQDIAASEITDEAVYDQRRDFMKASAGLALAPLLGFSSTANAKPEEYARLDFHKNDALSVKEKLTDYDDVTTYNNFYEFGTSKSAPAREAHR